MCAAAICVLGVPMVASGQQVLRMGGNFPASHGSSVSFEKVFKPEVARLTGGAVRVDVFPGSQLGSSNEQVDQLVSGQVPLVWSGPNIFSRLSPELEAAELPFAVASDAQAACLIDGELGEHLAERLAEKNVLILGWEYNGLRYITNSKRPINSLADLKGMKLRVPGSDQWMNTFRALGANPTPLDISEVYQALQQGVVDGQENPPENILVNNFQEVQKYITKSGHFFSWVLIVANKKSFEALKPEHQQAIRTAMAKAVQEQRRASALTNEAALKKLQTRMALNVPTREALAEMRKATLPVYDLVRKRVGDKTMDIAMKAIETCGSR
jgi:tripartite ATP-independent transporter DctP family solute receptor